MTDAGATGGILIKAAAQAASGSHAWGWVFFFFLVCFFCFQVYQETATERRPGPDGCPCYAVGISGGAAGPRLKQQRTLGGSIETSL